jgi:restriction endonuclease S subunit
MSGVNDKLFYINLSELEDRLDPLFYVAIKKMQKEIVDRAKYECVNLIKACSINRGRFGHRPRNDPRFYGGEYPFIQTGDIVKASENNDSIQFTQTLNELGLGTSKLFQPPKLLFTIAANIGDTALLDYPSCFPDSIVALIPHDDTISLEYLNIYLKHIKPYIEALAPYSAQKNLNNQQLAQIPLIIPPMTVQEEIVSIMNKVYREKQQKEAESKALLESIDNYLLSELGIELPEYDDSLESRIFTINLNKIRNSRYDCNFHSLKFQNIIKELNYSTYSFVQLKDILFKIKTGTTPSQKLKPFTKDKTHIPFLRNSNIQDGEIISYDFKYIKNNLSNYLTYSYTNEIIICIAGTIGVSVLNDFGKLSINQNVSSLKLDEQKINLKFLIYWLNTSLVNQLFKRLASIATIPYLNNETLLSLQIPLPPIKKQNEIAQQIQSMRDQAKQLQEEAKEVLEDAKREVKAMILK